MSSSAVAYFLIVSRQDVPLYEAELSNSLKVCCAAAGVTDSVQSENCQTRCRTYLAGCMSCGSKLNSVHFALARARRRAQNIVADGGFINLHLFLAQRGSSSPLHIKPREMRHLPEGLSRCVLLLTAPH